MLKKIAIALVVVVLGFVGVVAMQPSTFRIQRAQSIEAPAWVVFNILNNFHRWPAWSPWEKLDPNMTKKHSGPEAGVGSVYEWSGNDEVGTGKMTITESEPPKQVTIKLEFMEPWEATNTTLFALSSKGKDVEVSWAMEGENTFMGKAASLFMDMDEMVGKDFEAGLRELKKLAEREAKEIEKAKQAEAAEAEAKKQAEAAAVPKVEADADADAAE